ncbi:MAG: hypothetical protein ACOH2K_06075 [Burkholderiaceae bacterium]
MRRPVNWSISRSVDWGLGGLMAVGLLVRGAGAQSDRIRLCMIAAQRILMRGRVEQIAGDAVVGDRVSHFHRQLQINQHEGGDRFASEAAEGAADRGPGT